MSASSLRALPRLSLESTPRKATCLPQSNDARWRIGSSTRHGPHHEPQTFTTTGWPRSSRSRASRPLRPRGSRSLACWCSVASAGGAPSSFSRSSCAVIVAFFGWLGPLDSGAWLIPTATITPTTTVPAIHGSHLRIGERVSEAGPQPPHQGESAVSCVLLHGRGSTMSGRSLLVSPEEPGGSESPGTFLCRDSPFPDR